MTKQYWAILKFMEKNQTPLTPMEISIYTKIPTPTVRKHLQSMLKENIVTNSVQPRLYHKPEYYTTNELLKNYVSSLKKQKRRLQITVVQKLRGNNYDKHE